MSEPLKPLDPELARLFEAESRFPQADAQSRARVWSRVESVVGAPTVAPSSVTAATPSTLSRYALVASIAFVSGGIAGVAAYRALTSVPAPVASDVAAITSPPSPAVPAVAVPPVVPEVHLGPVASVAPDPVKASSATSPPRHASGAPSSRPLESRVPEGRGGSGASLAREQALIDVARQAFVRDHPLDALAAAERHQAEFPSGQLAEERDALRVLALIKAGRHDEGARRASEFLRRYPRSVLAPAVSSALESLR